MNRTTKFWKHAAVAAFAWTLASASALTAVERDNLVINLLVDCSHEYSFDLSNASRTESEIFRGMNCLTSVQTIHKLDLDPINALVVLTDGKMPYSPKDAPHLLDYVRQGGGLYICASSGGAYADSLKAFLAAFGLLDQGPPLSKDPADWGISAHAPSELVFQPEQEARRFTSEIGLWKNAGGSVAFEVYGDGRLLYKSPTLRGNQRESIDVSISGVKELRLVATDAGDGKNADASVWYNPQVILASGGSQRVLLRDAKSAKVGWSHPSQDRHFSGEPLSGKKPAGAGQLAPGIYPVMGKPELWPEVIGGRSSQPILTPIEPEAWQTLYANENGEPIVIFRKYGKGFIASDSAGLYKAAIGKREPQRSIMQRLIQLISMNKTVEPVRGGGGWQFSDGYRWDLVTTTEDGLRIHHTEYSSIYVDSDVRGYHETVKYLTELTGIDDRMKAAQIKELNDRKAPKMMGAFIDLDVSKVDTITLIAEDGGNGIGFDHSVFGEPRVYDSANQMTDLKLSEAIRVKSGYGQPKQDKLDDGSRLSIGGKDFDHAILLDANGEMSFNLDRKYRRFTTHVGASHRTGGASVNFRILGDGRELWNDGQVYTGGVPGGDPNDVNYVPEGILFQLKYLPCVGAGFLLPQGSAVDLPPALKDDWQVHLGMLSHEMGHAWSYPFTEVMGEESSAFIFNNLVLHRHHGQRHTDSVTRRLMNYLAQHPDLEQADLAKGANNFKYYMFIDLIIREYGEDVWKNYNLLKYALLNKEGAVWGPHATAWLWSVATGRDVFPDFRRAFATSVDESLVKLPPAAMDLGFDPVAVGKYYGVDLQRLPRQRQILTRLENFQDVRMFYADEYAEKGAPKVEG